MNFFLSLAIFLCPVFGFSQVEKQYPSLAQRKTFYQNLVQKYASADIREIFYSDTQNEFEKYIEGNSEKELINSYSTVIHELLHGYNNSENGGSYYFVEPGIRCFVPMGKYYNSKELNSYVRKGLQDSIFRYPLYIGGTQQKIGHAKGEIEEDGASIILGIYGLLEEYNAYYFGARSTYELYDYYFSNPGENISNSMKDYKHEILDDVMAYYEFNLFFGWYLIYAKEKHADVYNDILSNKPLRVAFSLIDDKFHKLVDLAEQQMDSVNEKIGPDLLELLDMSGSDDDVFRLWEFSGLTAEQLYTIERSVVNGKTVMVKKSIMNKEDFGQLKSEYKKMVDQIKNASGDGLMLFFSQPARSIAFLKKQFTPAGLKEVDKLRIKEVTSLNYQQYLK